MVDHQTECLDHQMKFLHKDGKHRDKYQRILETVKDAEAIDAFTAKMVWGTIHEMSISFFHIALHKNLHKETASKVIIIENQTKITLSAAAYISDI